MPFISEQITSKDINSLTNTNIDISSLDKGYAFLGKTENSHSNNYTLSGRNSTAWLDKKPSSFIKHSDKKGLSIKRFENYEGFNINENSDGSNFGENNFSRKGSNSSTAKLRQIDQEIQNIESNFSRGILYIFNK